MRLRIWRERLDWVAVGRIILLLIIALHNGERAQAAPVCVNDAGTGVAACMDGPSALQIIRDGDGDEIEVIVSGNATDQFMTYEATLVYTDTALGFSGTTAISPNLQMANPIGDYQPYSSNTGRIFIAHQNVANPFDLTGGREIFRMTFQLLTQESVQPLIQIGTIPLEGDSFSVKMFGPVEGQTLLALTPVDIGSNFNLTMPVELNMAPLVSNPGTNGTVLSMDEGDTNVSFNFNVFDENFILGSHEIEQVNRTLEAGFANSGVINTNFTVNPGSAEILLNPSHDLVLGEQDADGFADFTLTLTPHDTGTLAGDIPPDARTVTLRVNDVNIPPQVVSPGNRLINEGDVLSFTVNATDNSGESTFTYSMMPTPALPAGATLDVNSGVFTWDVGFDTVNGTQGQVTYDVTFGVQDYAGLSDLTPETITVTVVNTNQRPEVRLLLNKEGRPASEIQYAGALAANPQTPDILSTHTAKALVGQELTIRLEARDPDPNGGDTQILEVELIDEGIITLSDAISYGILGGAGALQSGGFAMLSAPLPPDGTPFVGEFTFTPTAVTSGTDTYLLRFRVQDTGLEGGSAIDPVERDIRVKVEGS